jgi:hypothetical protein
MVCCWRRPIRALSAAGRLIVASPPPGWRSRPSTSSIRVVAVLGEKIPAAADRLLLALHLPTAGVGPFSAAQAVFFTARVPFEGHEVYLVLGIPSLSPDT